MIREFSFYIVVQSSLAPENHYAKKYKINLNLQYKMSLHRSHLLLNFYNLGFTWPLTTKHNFFVIL